MGAIRQSVRQARAVRPSRVRQAVHRKFTLTIVGADMADREALVQVFAPAGLGREDRERASSRIVAGGDGREGIRVRTPRAHGPGVPIDPSDPEPGLIALLRAQPDHQLALARAFPPLREMLARELIRAVAARNASLAAISALPDVIPTPLSLILALGEMGSDTVLITANQIGLCFHLAALRGEPVGWSAQAGRVGTIVLGALGWRTMARELVGLIPAGVGLVAKASIAYSGTMAVGTALWKSRRREQPVIMRPRAVNRTGHQTLATERQSA